MNRIIEAALRSKEYRQTSLQQGLAFERRRWQRATDGARSLAEIVDAVSDPRVAAMYLATGRTFGLQRRLERAHKLITGGTGSGKSTYARLLLVAIALEAAARTLQKAGRSVDLDAAVPDAELLIMDPKDDAPRYKAAMAAMYLQAPPAVQLVLLGSFLAIEFRRDRVTPRSLLLRYPGVSVEFQATQITDAIILTSPADWSATMQALLYQLVRFLLYLDWPFDSIAIRALLTDRGLREHLLRGLPPDLADYFGRLDVAPQTVAALLRRIQILLSYPEVRAMLSVLPGHRIGGKARRLVLADCGTLNLPPSIGLAIANLLVTEVGLVAGTRDRSVEKTVFLDEAAYVLSQVTTLLQQFLNVLRILRSSNTAFWFAVQSLQPLPSSAVEDVLTNVGQMLAFQSRGDIASILAPHMLVEPGDRRRENERRAAFSRELASLPPQEAVLWVKGFDAFRMRVADAPDPVRSSGVPEDELIDIFDSQLATGSTLPLTAVDRMLEAWRAEHLPADRPSRSVPKAGPTLQDLFGPEEEA